MLAPVADAVAAQAYDRIVLSGMGSSYYAAYPAWLELVNRGLPAWSVTAAELLHGASSLVTKETLVWLTSQSGASAEVVALLKTMAGSRPKTILGTTAQLDSPLGRGADTVLQLHIGAESTVSAGSYVATLAVQHLAVTQFAGGDVEPARRSLFDAAAALTTYLEDWRRRVERWESLLGLPERLFIIGRGRSLAAALTGSLIIKESARIAVEGMSAAQFRHGPLELADEHLTVIVLAGPERTRALNEKLAVELQEYGANVVWLASEAHSSLATVTMPLLPPPAAPVAEIVPLQLLSLALASQSGVEPGVFRHIGKVTRTL